MGEIKIEIIKTGSVTDVSQLVTDITWSGNYKQCARTLAFGLLNPVFDKNIPKVDCPPGTMVRFTANKKVCFYGVVVTRARDSGGNTKSITAYDLGFYLNRNETTMAIKNQTPEAVTREICGKFGITAGNIAVTNVKLTRNFLPSSGGANKLYSIIQTMYTLAAEKTGKRYMVRFEGNALSVITKSVSEYVLVLRPGSNMLTSNVTDSIEQTVNQVLVYDKNDKLLSSKKDDASIAQYGRLQSVIKRAEKETESAAGLATKELEDNPLSQKITVTNMGSLACLAGNTVIVKEPSTGLSGVFWIDEDYHYWKKGIYTDKLVINYKCLMDEQTGGK